MFLFTAAQIEKSRDYSPMESYARNIDPPSVRAGREVSKAQLVRLSTVKRVCILRQLKLNTIYMTAILGNYLQINSMEIL